jgi:hypothetical protein
MYIDGHIELDIKAAYEYYKAGIFYASGRGAAR